MVRRALAVLTACLSFTGAFSQTITTGIINPTTYCAGATINVPFTSTGVYGPGNVYTAELSDAGGTFLGTFVGTLTSNANTGTVVATVPSTTAQGAAYRIRIRSSVPAVIGAQSPMVLTINALGINAPTTAATTYCQGQAITVNYTLTNACNFPNTPANNVFTAELSDGFGSFAAPTTLGTATSNAAGAIAGTVPTSVPGGNGYRIRVRSSNPGGGVTGATSASNITINVIGMNAPTTGATTYCAGTTFNLAYTFVAACNYLPGNVFTAQLSDASGSWAAPQTVGSATQTGTGNVGVTIPSTQAGGTGYKLRIVSSNPVTTGPDIAANITINALSISTPTFTGTSFCQGSALAIAYTVNGCVFPNTPTANVFTAQLSNSAGSFASPTNIGTNTSNNNGTINAVIPAGQAAGTGYRIRVVSSNPTVIASANNGTDLTINATSGSPATYGTTAWNAYVYSGTAFPITGNQYLGTYTETALNFNTQTRFGSSNPPSDANATGGTAYAGCAAAATNYSVSFKRTNFTCGYYQIDIPAHDDNVRLIIDGAVVYSHIGCCDAHTNVWTGFLGPASQVDFQYINFGGNGYLQVAFSAAANPIVTSAPTTVCSTSNTQLTASAPVALNYAWTPTTNLTPSDGLGATVTAAPTTTTTYTVTGTDATTSCTLQKTVLITVVAPAAVPTLTLTNSTPTICSGVTTSTLTVSGANTYTWSPAAGLSATTGTSVTANPATTTTYTVTGTTGCQSNTATATVTVQNIPSSPPTTQFGNGVWNVFAHNNTTLSNFYGYYTENNLSFSTATRWNENSGPTVANATTGLAYSGCSFGSTNYSMSFKRTNFTCGYYQLDVNYQDDQFTFLVDGVQVFQNNAYTTTTQSAVWSGFLSPTSQVEMRLVNGGGPGRLQVTFGITQGPQTLSPNVTICTGTSTNLTSSSTAYPGATFAWSHSPATGTITYLPSANSANATLQTTAGTPSATYTVTNTMTDAGGTGCTATRNVLVTVAATPTTAVTPTSSTIICTTQTVTLTASGANTYTWSPAAGLSATTGNVVIAQPTTTTTYTVTGDNNCATSTANSTVTVVPLPDYNTFPTNTWNVYGFNSQTVGTNYQGYYTENGSGSPAYSFNTSTRWASATAPSSTNTTNGTGWTGCTMPTTNFSLSAKRKGFLCGTYTIDITSHDDNFVLLVNGVQVAQHVGCCDTHTGIWTGALSTNSTVEFQLVQGTGGSGLGVSFTRVAPGATTAIWMGTTDTDWFTASNWCGTTPATGIDVVIPPGGPNMPLINNTGAIAFSVTINSGAAATAYSSAIPAPSLSMNAFNLDVRTNFTNNGTFNAGTGTVSFITAAAGTIAGNSTFNNLVINKTNGVTISSGTTQQIGGTMTFTSGLVTQSGTLRFNAGSAVATPSDASHVVGVVTKVGNTAFTFPVGRGGLYRPIGISAPGVITDTYTANYLNSSILGTYPNSSRAVTLDHVSNAEHWLLNRTVGTSTVNVTLSWNSNSGGVLDPPSLRVAGWNGSLWADLGNASTTGTTASGTVTASVASGTSFPYTLASTTFFNALPVQLSDMLCGLNSFGNPQIDWSTTTEINSDYFEIERSLDGRAFQSIARIPSKGDSKDLQRYSYEDVNAPDGKSYYRLKQYDRDGRSMTFEVCAMNVVSTGLSVTPNPASGRATIKLHSAALQELSIINSIGQKVNVNFVVKDSIVDLDVSTLAPGVYMIRITTGNKSGVLRLVKS